MTDGDDSFEYKENCESIDYKIENEKCIKFDIIN
jgi:hypothetical protein